MTRRAAALALAFLVAADAQAGFFVGPGATAANYLKIPTNGRAAAMAGAFTAMAGDVTAMEYNPAGISRLDRTDLNASYIKYIEDTSLHSVAAAFPVGRTAKDDPSHGWRMGLQYRGLRTDDQARSDLGVNLGKFSITEQMGHVAAAYSWGPRLTLGAGGKYLSSSIRGVTATSFAGDAGLLWSPAPKWSVGVSALTIGSDLKYISKGDPLPSELRAGVAWRDPRVDVAVDAALGRDEILTKTLGFDFHLTDIVSLRAGVSHGENIQFAGGVGVHFDGPPKGVYEAPQRRTLPGERLPRRSTRGVTPRDGRPKYPNVGVGLDYAARTHPELGLTHILTLKIRY